MAPPLRKLKMLDLSRQLPGPFCSLMLADLGVDVLVVAAPNDVMGIGIPLIQRNKRSMTLNLKSPEGKQIFDRLAADADIILEGFRPGVTDRLGIDYASMAKVNPRVVYCSISGYGQDGPYRDKVGHDINYLGYAGVLGVSGGAGNSPTVMPVQVADIGGGALMAVVGILSALMAREHTGQGYRTKPDPLTHCSTSRATGHETSLPAERKNPSCLGTGHHWKDVVPEPS